MLNEHRDGEGSAPDFGAVTPRCSALAPVTQVSLSRSPVIGGSWPRGSVGLADAEICVHLLPLKVSVCSLPPGCPSSLLAGVGTSSGLC